MMRPLAVVGNINVDLILGPVSPWPRPGTEVLVENEDLRPGGSAGNTGLAWAGLGLAYRLAGSIGSDHYGPWLKAAFGAQGASLAVTPGPTTLSVGLTHPNAERTFFTTHGHLPAFTLDHALAGLNRAPLAGGLLLVCGTFLTPALTARYVDLFTWAERQGLDIALDTGWPLDGWTDGVIAQVRSWLPRCRHLLLNEIETMSLAGTADATSAAQALASLMPEDGVVVVKRGPDGALAQARGQALVSAPGQRVSVVDTVGAGDVFNAGYLAAIACGQSLGQALAAGIATASTAISTAPRRYGRFLPLDCTGGTQ